jgi:hypothetical protein
MDQELHSFLGKMLAAMRHVVGSMPNPSNQVWHTLAGLEREHAALAPPPAPTPPPAIEMPPMGEQQRSSDGRYIADAPQPDHSPTE